MAITGGSPSLAQAPPVVPAEFQDLYGTLSSDLDAYNSTLNSVWNGSKYPALFAGNFAVANGNGGPDMLDNYNPAAQNQLQAIKATGARAVLVQVGFPILYSPFFDYLATQPGYEGVTYDKFVSYYRQVAQDVRAAGLKLIVENSILLSNNVQAGWPGLDRYYATLTWDQYQAARAQCALNLVQVMQPDYIVILEEPSNEADQTGQTDAGTPDGAAALLNQILASLQPVRASVKVGAGVANWQPHFNDFISSFVNLPLDTIDLHIYPINSLGAPSNLNFVSNAMTGASMALAAGKQVSVSEAWLWKMRDSEWGVLTADQFRARNPFDFWAPLDAYFLQLLVNFGYYTKAAFIAPCGPYYFAAYLPYDDTTKNLSPGDILNQETAAAVAAMATATYTTTATSYHDSLVSPPDATPPSMPFLLTSNVGTDSVYLTWSASSDNIGVAGYSVSRNGQQIATTAQPQFSDSGLTDNTEYTYQIQAFDLAGNQAPPLSDTVTTRNGTTPGPPINLSGSAVSCTQISLTWSPPPGNIPITSYLVFMGTSQTNPVQVGQTDATHTAYNAVQLTPGTTYYFGVEAVATGLTSPMSVIIPVTTLAPPSAPANLAASAPAAVRVTLTWLPSTGGMPIAAYHILRGPAPGNLDDIDSRASTTYTDTTVSPATTYYYAVQAIDTGGNLSPLSRTVMVKTPAMPPAPVNLVVTAPAPTRISVTWSPVTADLPISNYRLLRGTSAANMTQLAKLLNPSYTDVNVSPGTKYCYAVQAVDSGGDVSPPSATVCATTPALPSVPANLTATALSCYKISLTWSASAGGLPIAAYRIYRGATPGSTVQIATRNTTSFTDTNLTPATTYYYAVQAVDSSGAVSPLSPAVLGATPALPSAPANVTATAISKKQINVAWAASAGGTGIGSYRIYRGLSPGPLTQVATRTGTAYTDTAVSPATTYYYAVQAVDTAGDASPMSAIASAKTPN